MASLLQTEDSLNHVFQMRGLTDMRVAIEAVGSYDNQVNGAFQKGFNLKPRVFMI